METVRYPVGWFSNPEIDCDDCVLIGCIDGQIDGLDGDGRETSDQCPCPHHKPKPKGKRWP
jgi:hypothetical protein